EWFCYKTLQKALTGVWEKTIISKRDAFILKKLNRKL
ncbi:unnamed protein product, partial [marine sediment metagenome]